MKRIFTLICALSIFHLSSFAQTVTLYSQNFGTGASLPTGWTTSSPVINPSNTNSSTGYTGASGGGNILLSDEPGGGTSGTQTIVFNGVSTVGFTSIVVNWFAASDVNGDFSAGPTLEWSTDGTNWNPRTFTNINFDGTWNTISGATLPVGAEGATNLQIRISFPYTQSFGTYQIDDFTITGTGSGSYYSKATGNLNDLTTWGTNTDGSGSNPSNFTASSQTFNIRNNANPTIAGNWVVNGVGTKVVIESGSNFTIPSGFNATINSGASLDINSGGTLTISNTSVSSSTLTFGTLATGSTVVYSASNLAAIPTTYSNLTTSSGVITQSNGNITVNGVLTLNGQFRLNNGSTLTLNGTLAGAQEFRGNNAAASNAANIIINGTGDLGQPIRLASNGQNLGVVTINRGGSGVVNLGPSFNGTGTAMIINNQMNLQQGILALNTISLTFNTNAVLNSSSGLLRGSASANITFRGCGNGGNLIMDTSSPANGTLNNLTTQRPLSLSSDLILTTLVLQAGDNTCVPLTAGIFSMDNSTLTLQGPSISFGTGTSFNTTANSSLVFSGSSAGVAIPTTVTALKNLTINNANGVIQQSTITVNNTLTLQSGTFNVNYQRLVLNSSVTSTGGTFSSDVSGIIEYNQSSAGQNVLAGTYGNLTFSNFNKVLPSGTINIGNVFTAGSATGHTVPSGNTINYVGPFGQTLASFNYANLTVSTVGGGRIITIPNGAVYGISGSFDPGIDTYSLPSSYTVNFNGTGNQSIPASFVYCSLIASNGGTKTLAGNITSNCGVTVSTGTTLSTGGANNINLAGGDFTNNGTFVAGTGDVTFSSLSSGQNIAGSGTTGFYNLTISNSSSAGVTNNATVTLQNALTLANGSAKLDPDGTSNNNNFTLLSDASADARIAAVPAGGQISGQIIVQRYLSNPSQARKYRYLASPVVGSTVADWQNEIPITGTFSDPSSGAYDGSNMNSTTPSLFYYDETQGTSGKTRDEGYVAYPSSGTAASNALTNGLGYALFVRRSSNSTPTVTLDLKGTPRIGTINLPFTFTSTAQGSAEDGWNLLGNPYAAPINWQSLVLPANLDGTVYIKSNVGVNGTTPGSFVYYNQSTGGVPASYTGQIASGQAFFVKANSSGILDITESSKTTSALLYKTTAPSNKLRISLKGGNIYDETLVCFLDNATDKFDGKYDAYKWETEGISTFTAGDTSKLAINALSQVTCNKELTLSVKVSSTGVYTMKFFDFQNYKDAKITLTDGFSGKSLDVTKDTVYSFNITDDASSKAGNRFKLKFEKESTKPVIQQTALTLTSSSKSGNQWLKDGQPIAGATSTSYQVTQDGTYSVEATTVDGCKSVSDAIVMKVTATEATVSVKGIRVSPNPTSADLVLDVEDFQGKTLKVAIYSMGGKLVSEQILTPDNGKTGFTLKTRTLASGLYMLKSTDGDKVRVIKFIKE
jgi:hypothetical protein